jgi:hypothetical protein
VQSRRMQTLRDHHQKERTQCTNLGWKRSPSHQCLLHCVPLSSPPLVPHYKPNSCLRTPSLCCSSHALGQPRGQHHVGPLLTSQGDHWRCREWRDEKVSGGVALSSVSNSVLQRNSDDCDVSLKNTQNIT